MKNNKGFTLIELIVIIGILTILGTIAFLSIIKYTKASRDSTRIADMQLIQESLELFNLKTGKYPTPSNYTNVTYSGTTTWLQGTIGESVITNLERLNKIPKDPKFENEYTYSTTIFSNEYEIGGINETTELVKNINLSNNLYAYSNSITARTSGNFNNFYLKTKILDIYYLLNIPSIILSDLSSNEKTEIKTMGDNNIVYNNQSNFPSSYSGTKLEMNGGTFTFESINISYSGTYLPVEEEEYLTFINNVKNDYKNTNLNNYKNYEIVLNTSETGSLIILAKALLSDDTYDGGSLLSYLASLESGTGTETGTGEEIPDPPLNLPIIDLGENEIINCGWCN